MTRTKAEAAKAGGVTAHHPPHPIVLSEIAFPLRPEVPRVAQTHAEPKANDVVTRALGQAADVK